jgi:uncharacterized protein involved in response to NO
MGNEGRTAIPRLQVHQGAALLAYGFRPFFLLAGLSAALGLLLWLADLAGVLALPTAFDPVAWHTHEMLFGFTTAAVAGFLLTALPNWTGRLPLQGTPLLVLVLLWLAGRLAVASSAVIGGWTAAVIDVGFLAVLMAAVAREIVAGKNWRNAPMLTAIAALLAANGLMHGEALGVVAWAGAGWRLAIAVIVLLIVLIGGRIVPSFTRNWLAKRGETSFPAPFGALDQATLGATLLALLVWVALPASVVAAPVQAIAAVLNAVRLGRWRGHRSLADPLVFVLHLGYAWVAVGLALLAAGQIPGMLPETTAVHGLTAGAFGTMTLAVMTRATLGHTGRELRAGAGTTLVYALVSVAALTRVTAVLWPAAYDALLWTSGLAWIAAFGGFVVLYGPMLASPRVDGRPG